MAESAAAEAVDVLALLAEGSRLRVVAALALGAVSPTQVASAAGLDLRATIRALHRLEGGGLVAEAGGGWRLRSERFADIARRAAPARDTDDHGAGDPSTAAVLRAFLRDGRLVRIPAVRSKRLVVLDHVARLFEPGVRYPEREVNAVLRAFHVDYAALRRHLVDEGFLERADGEYWRSGGYVDV